MKKRMVIIIGLVFLLVSSFYTINYFFLMPTIKLIGKQDITINYKQDYKELGYKANYKNKNLTKNVKVKGKVKSNKLGIYKINYSLKKGLFTKKIVRTVKVRDISKPKILLESKEENIYICPKAEYNIEKYTAYDNYDKDITDRVKVTRKDNIVKYAVVDSSGNYTVEKRKIIKKDKESPELELNEGNVIFSYLNDEFKDPGYKAFDNCDEDITNIVEVEGKVDISTAGSYELFYKIVDSSGNLTKVARKINVVKKGENGTIYLTFDDGPRMGTTNVILDILKEENVKATFFVTNSGPDELISREYLEGHTVGLHTASHNYALIYANQENYFNDLYAVRDRVLNITGHDSKIIRFPGGSSNTISRRYKPGIMSELTKSVVEKGYKYYDWNINSRDTDGLTNSVDIAKQVQNNLSLDRVNVVLMHDIKTYTRDALKNIIHYGKENGYHFEAITEDSLMITQTVKN